MKVASGIFTLDDCVYKKNEKTFQRPNTSNASGLSFDLFKTKL